MKNSVETETQSDKITTTNTGASEDVIRLPGGKVKILEPQKLIISSINRNKHKYTTMVEGLERFEIDLETTAKMFKKKFSCGCSVVESNDGEAIEIQGDFSYELHEFVPKNWPQISLDKIEMRENVKRRPPPQRRKKKKQQQRRRNR